MSLRERIQADEGAPAVFRILAARNEVVILEIACQLAGPGQGQPQLAREVAHRARLLGRDVCQNTEVPAAERRLIADQRKQLVRRTAAVPEAALNAPQQLSQLVQLVVGNTHRPVIVILR